MKYRDHAEILPLPERAGQSWTHVTDDATRQLTGWPVWSAFLCHGPETLALPPVKRLFIYCDGDLQGWLADDVLARHPCRRGQRFRHLRHPAQLRGRDGTLRTPLPRRGETARYGGAGQEARRHVVAYIAALMKRNLLKY